MLKRGSVLKFTGEQIPESPLNFLAVSLKLKSSLNFRTRVFIKFIFPELYRNMNFNTPDIYRVSVIKIWYQQASDSVSPWKPAKLNQRVYSKYSRVMAILNQRWKTNKTFIPANEENQNLLQLFLNSSNSSPVSNQTRTETMQTLYPELNLRIHQKKMLAFRFTNSRKCVRIVYQVSEKMCESTLVQMFHYQSVLRYRM